MAKTEKLRVAESGITAMIQRLGLDCGPSQFVREFTQNCIEAVVRTSKGGTIQIDYHPHFQPKNHPDLGHKICFVDNGDGMTGDEMCDLLNNLAASGDIANEFSNYGMGAKIAAFTRNHAGIIYESWKDGVGSQVVFHYDEEEGSYGIKPIVDSEGNAHHVAPASDANKPDCIDGHGTRVTLFGMSFGQDTMLPPPDVLGGRDFWILNYLNTRYFRVPEGISILARAHYHRPEDGKHNSFLRVIGQKAVLDKCSDSKGTVRLSDALVHWWILKSDRNIGEGGREFNHGHCACVHQNEVLEITRGRSNRAKQFGIYIGAEDIAIYVEVPKGYRQNTTRTQLQTETGRSLQWDRWQDEFTEKFPVELKNFLEARVAGLQNESHGSDIRKRLEQVKHLFKLSKYKVSHNGAFIVDENSTTTGQTGHLRTGEERGETSHAIRGRGSAAGKLDTLLAATLTNQGLPAEKTTPDPFPRVTWVSAFDQPPSRHIDDELEDRAAEYNRKANQITANADFQGFSDLRKDMESHFSDVEGAAEIIKDEVHAAVEQQLMEVVAGAISLNNRPHWTPEDVAQATSPEALTTAVSCRYHMVNQIRRNLGAKLQKVKKDEIKAA